MSELKLRSLAGFTEPGGKTAPKCGAESRGRRATNKRPTTNQKRVCRDYHSYNFNHPSGTLIIFVALCPGTSLRFVQGFPQQHPRRERREVRSPLRGSKSL